MMCKSTDNSNVRKSNFRKNSDITVANFTRKRKRKKKKKGIQVNIKQLKTLYTIIPGLQHRKKVTRLCVQKH